MPTTISTTSSITWPASSFNLVFTTTTQLPPEDPPASTPAIRKPFGPLPTLNASA